MAAYVVLPSYPSLSTSKSICESDMFQLDWGYHASIISKRQEQGIMTIAHLLSSWSQK